MEQLQQLTEAVASNNKKIAENFLRQLADQKVRTSVTDATTAGGQETGERRQTRSMTAPTQQVPRVHEAAVPKMEKQPHAVGIMEARAAALLMKHAKKMKQRQKKKTAARLVPADVPARNTRAQKRYSGQGGNQSSPSVQGNLRVNKRKKNAAAKAHAVDSVIQKENAEGSSVVSGAKSTGKKLSARKRMQRLEN